MPSDKPIILLVEDEPAHAEAVRRTVVDVWPAAEVHVAATLGEFHQMAESTHPDIAIMDLNLPDGKAIDALSPPSGEHPFPVVVMTSYGSERVAVEAMKAGAMDYAVKSSEAIAGLPLTIERTLREWELRVSHKKAEEDRRELEAQMQRVQKLESLGILAGGIAHDFNNILMSILGNAELALLDLPADSPARPCIEDIGVAGRRAAGLTQQMLAYSGKGRFEIEPLDLNEIVREIVHLLESSVPKRVSLRLPLNTGLPLTRADAAQLQQVILNLVSNAAESFADHQNGEITVSTQARFYTEEELQASQLPELLPQGKYVALRVSDTGSGMTKEVLDQLFDPFFTTKFPGRGLGMSAVLGIVRGHKGAILVDSVPEQGTTVQVLFPALEPSLSPTCTIPLTGNTAPAAKTGLILFVDDEEPVQDIGRRALTRLGYEVITASDGVEALEHFKERGKDILCTILDLSMPRMDGEQTLHELRRLQKDCRVILSSGFAVQELASRFTGETVDAFIEKPYSISTLQQKLNQVLGKID